MRTFVIWAVVLLATAVSAVAIGVAVAYYQPAPAAAQLPAGARGAEVPPLDPARSFQVSGQGMNLQELVTHLRQQAAAAGAPVTVEVKVIVAEGPDGTIRLLMPGPGYAGNLQALSTVRVTFDGSR